MPSRRLSPETALSVKLDALLGRHAFTTDPAPVVQALQELAGARSDLAEQAAGRWVGWHESDPAPYQPLVSALRPLADSATTAAARRTRRNPHGRDVAPPSS
ncbi:hypothetical protein KV097_18905 [Mumia sp. zg.B17]|uniref:hypothetical protein n=1 Tax=Mumia sp. zg.B17 TaxID=2855446 RepID=UPI001C6EAAD2|nr:hypothetical protein [Mumia sp. zg.B17]MBW9208014.1 hypothetical protein [Mumia sp. zg.B17]